MPPFPVPNVSDVVKGVEDQIREYNADNNPDITINHNFILQSVQWAFNSSTGGPGQVTLDAIVADAYTHYADALQGGTGDNPFGDAPRPGNTDSPATGPAPIPVENYLTQLQGFGIPLTAAVRAFAAQAAGSRWSGAEFLFNMRQQSWYRNEFPGIFNKDGTMKMSEAQYISTKNAYEDIANTLGFNLSDQMAGLAFKNDLSVNEFRARYTAERLIKDNPTYMNQLINTLKARGLELPKHGDLAEFLMNEKPTEFYKVWREASARGAAVMSGLHISKHPAFGNDETGIGRAAILNVAKMGLTPAQLAGGFKQLADLLIQDLPESQAMMQGVSKKEFTAAVFGGKGSGRSREKVQGLLRTIDAYYNEKRAGAELSSTGQGGTQQIGTEGLAGGQGNVQ